VSLKFPHLVCRDRLFEWGKKTYLMGVLNVTPDSFSDGGEFFSVEKAIDRAIWMVESGVDIIDIGGESSRPGSIPVDLSTELDRTIPIIQALRKESITAGIPISIDTTKAIAAKEAIAAGADIINDISGGTFDGNMLAAAADLKVPICLMHLRGNPRTMQQMTDYQNVVGDVIREISRSVDLAITAGIEEKNIILDPGIGFAKTTSQNLDLLRGLPELRALGYPLLVGVSRKSFIGNIIDRPYPQDRLWGTAAACTSAISFGTDILRVHDVDKMKDVSRIADAIYRDR
jgi:dihydropteroate synthase